MPKGFTLVEVLVAIAVLAIATVLAIPNLNKFSNDQTFSTAITEVVNNLRKAQTNAQTGVKCANTQSSVSWRLIFSTSSQYSLSAECKDPSTGAVVPIQQAAYNPADISLEMRCNTTAISPLPAELAFSSITFGNSTLVIYPCTTATDTFTLKMTSIKTTDVKYLKIDRGGSASESTTP